MRETEEAYAEQVRERLEKPFHRRVRELGYTLTKLEPPPREPSASEPSAAPPT